MPDLKAWAPVLSALAASFSALAAFFSYQATSSNAKTAATALSLQYTPGYKLSCLKSPLKRVDKRTLKHTWLLLNREDLGTKEYADLNFPLTNDSNHRLLLTATALVCLVVNLKPVYDPESILSVITQGLPFHVGTYILTNKLSTDLTVGNSSGQTLADVMRFASDYTFEYLPVPLLLPNETFSFAIVNFAQQLRYIHFTPVARFYDVADKLRTGTYPISNETPQDFYEDWSLSPQSCKFSPNIIRNEYPPNVVRRTRCDEVHDSKLHRPGPATYIPGAAGALNE